MTKILQSIPYPTYSTVDRDLLTNVLLNTKINNSDTGKVEEWNGTSWNSEGGGGHTISDATQTLPQEPILQFTGNVEVSAGTGKTVVNIPNQSITIDATPTDGSTNAVASNGVFDALSLKADKVTITGATKTKVSYNAQGIVTGGADATTADIADSLNKRYITDSQQTVLGNTSGVNSGNQTALTLPITTPSGYTATEQQTFDNETAQKIIDIQTQISANQLTFASIYGYYNFI